MSGFIKFTIFDTLKGDFVSGTRDFGGGDTLKGNFVSGSQAFGDGDTLKSNFVSGTRNFGDGDTLRGNFVSGSQAFGGGDTLRGNFVSGTRNFGGGDTLRGDFMSGTNIDMQKEDFGTKENCCERLFVELGECYHLWTPENFDLIFTDEHDFKVGMGILGICAKLFLDIRILTFEVMSNHLHITCAGTLDRILRLFEAIKDMLRRLARSKGRTINWEEFIAKTRRLDTLSDVRNVIVYVNRNGYLISNKYTPFTYPWGANRFYFNPDACNLAKCHAVSMHIREIRTTSHVRYADYVKGLLKFDGYALPLSFCEIETGERLFRDASHYFNKISRSIESNAAIAKEIGESIHYTDDEIFDIVSRTCRQQYGDSQPSRINSVAKIELARTMRFEYNATTKQIQRILKLDSGILASLFQQVGHY